MDPDNSTQKKNCDEAKDYPKEKDRQTTRNNNFGFEFNDKKGEIDVCKENGRSGKPHIEGLTTESIKDLVTRNSKKSCIICLLKYSLDKKYNRPVSTKFDSAETSGVLRFNSCLACGKTRLKLNICKGCENFVANNIYNDKNRWKIEVSQEYHIAQSPRNSNTSNTGPACYQWQTVALSGKFSEQIADSAQFHRCDDCGSFIQSATKMLDEIESSADISETGANWLKNMNPFKLKVAFSNKTPDQKTEQDLFIRCGHCGNSLKILFNMFEEWKVPPKLELEEPLQNSALSLEVAKNPRKLEDDPMECRETLRKDELDKPNSFENFSQQEFLNDGAIAKETSRTPLPNKILDSPKLESDETYNRVVGNSRINSSNCSRDEGNSSQILIENCEQDTMSPEENYFIPEMVNSNLLQSSEKVDGYPLFIRLPHNNGCSRDNEGDSGQIMTENREYYTVSPKGNSFMPKFVDGDLQNEDEDVASPLSIRMPPYSDCSTDYEGDSGPVTTEERNFETAPSNGDSLLPAFKNDTLQNSEEGGSSPLSLIKMSPDKYCSGGNEGEFNVGTSNGVAFNSKIENGNLLPNAEKDNGSSPPIKTPQSNRVVWQCQGLNTKFSDLPRAPNQNVRPEVTKKEPLQQTICPLDVFEDALKEVENSKLMLFNLDPKANKEAIKDLLADFGSIKKMKIYYDAAGRSLGIAGVNFGRRADALRLLQAYKKEPYAVYLKDIKVYDLFDLESVETSKPTWECSDFEKFVKFKEDEKKILIRQSLLSMGRVQRQAQYYLDKKNVRWENPYQNWKAYD